MSQTHIPASPTISIDDAFLQRFKWWGPGWSAVTMLFIVAIDYTILHDESSYFHDWRFPVIIALSCAIVAIYASCILFMRRFTAWPPPFKIAFSVWLCLYVIVVLLTLINQAFAWYFFAVFGTSLSMMTGRRLIVLVTILFLSVCAVNGYFTQPFNTDNIGGIVGLALSFYGTTAISLVMQTLLRERYTRNRLLQELAQTNTELAAAHQKLAETATQEQELAVLRERTRLAREMHDTLGHALVLVTVKLEVAQRLRERDPQRCERELEAAQEIVRESMNNLRTSIANLRSPALEHEPVCRALGNVAHEIAQRTGIHVNCTIASDIDTLPEQVEETLWKVGQEALINIEKHAHASTLTLHVSRHDARVLMRIEDDGVGIPDTLTCTGCKSPEGHYGLRGMRERVESCGGCIQIKAGQGHGTIVEVELPLIEVTA